jgi:Cu/Ag efflux pump CusA
MQNIDYALILSTHFAINQWTLNGDDYDGLTWLSDSVKPTKEELDALWDSTLEAVEQKKTAAIAARQEVLDRLGITAEEAQLILGGSN